MSSSTSTSALKARHYNALGNALRQLQNGLQNSEYQMDRLSDHLGSMQKLGTHSAAQFMAVSRLLDKELNDLNELEMQRRVEEEKGAEQAAAGQTEQARQ